MASREINPTNMSPEAARAEVEYLLCAGMKMQREINDLKRPEVFKVGEETFISSGTHYERIQPAKPEKIVRPGVFETFSLDGLIDFIKEDVDGFFKDPSRKFLVRVTSPAEVQVISPITGYWMERCVVAQCEAVVPDNDYSRFRDPEKFQIMVQTCFEDSENRAKVLLLAGNLSKEQNMTTADDGVSQKVTINSGVATKADVIVKNPVTLTPYRTFREVDQPESPFVIRVNENAEVALFTGDGSVWKLEAVSRIAEYLRNNLLGYNVKIIA